MGGAKRGPRGRRWDLEWYDFGGQTVPTIGRRSSVEMDFTVFNPFREVGETHTHKEYLDTL